MPTLAHGRLIAKLYLQLYPGSGLRRYSSKGFSSKGFTLIEVMVTLMIASVVFGMAMLSLRSLDRSLQIEAQRVAQLLSFARDYAQMRGRAVRFEADELGYRFISRSQGDWALILDEPILRERTWDQPTQVRLERFGANPFSSAGNDMAGTLTNSVGSSQSLASNANAGNIIEFGRDYVDSPFTVWLAQNTQKVAIAANGLGKFTVQSEATQ
jgi:general secretion pathway protein H